uniref:Uncharacterized protein n=1 Tax=Candidatus Methanogaster sp. ANME-2c ERB4 TaxID=2759911 RepID=A0A7G9YEG5_9EURY|nr:hypothetical protein NIBJONLA_00016 [Methanosarcinales archaeon ANME-2c ERB4]
MSVHKGFKELKELSVTDAIPKMTSIQAGGSRPVVDVCAKPIEVDVGIDAVRRAVFG